MSVVADGSAVGLVAGDEYGKAHVGRVEGGSHVGAVLAFGSVDVVSGGSRVGLVEGADSEGVAVVGVVDVDSRVGVLGEYARVGFVVGADSVSDSAGAARLLDVRLRRESSGGGVGVGLPRRRSFFSCSCAVCVCGGAGAFFCRALGLYCRLFAFWPRGRWARGCRRACGGRAMCERVGRVAHGLARAPRLPRVWFWRWCMLWRWRCRDIYVVTYFLQ